MTVQVQGSKCVRLGGVIVKHLRHLPPPQNCLHVSACAGSEIAIVCWGLIKMALDPNHLCGYICSNMINHLVEQLSSQVQIVLASSSPRRLEILAIVGLKPEV